LERDTPPNPQGAPPRRPKKKRRPPRAPKIGAKNLPPKTSGEGPPIKANKGEMK